MYTLNLNTFMAWQEQCMIRSFVWYTVQDQAAQSAWAVKLAYDVTTIKGS